MANTMERYRTDSGTLNLADLDENKNPLMPSGKYEAEVTEASHGDSNAGNPMTTLKFRIDDASQDEEDQDRDEDERVNGRSLNYYLVLNNNYGMRQYKKALMILSPDIDMSNVDPDNAEEYFAGKRCIIEVGKQKGQDGIWRNNVRQVLPLGGDSMFGNGR